ncbi:MAG: SDR family oxidoreductase [Nitrosomonadaceae bacterium]|nr:SDR family oxidoreductase [Nitrosomonadaceae bacterium]
MRVLVLGASGMLGNAMLRVVSGQESWSVYGTLRSPNPALQALAPKAQLLHGIHADQPDSLLAAFAHSRPEVVINCVGLVKQLASADDPLEAIPINALLPHRLARLCELAQARLVHVSTDCVFSGCKGMYRESDMPDAEDLYGRSKLLGEVSDRHAITLRTSIIGHELGRDHGLVGWFLSQQGRIKGYTEAIFSGLPTFELARVVRDHVIPNTDLHGLYHVAAEPISKHDLLQIVNRIYGKALQIEPDDRVKINRSLDASRFKEATGYVAPAWSDLIAQMHEFR